MGNSKKYGKVILASVIVAVLSFWYSLQKPYSKELVVNSLWDKYEVQSSQIGDTDPVISIDVYDKKEIPEVERYLKNNLSKDDLEYYEVQVFSQWS